MKEWTREWVIGILENSQARKQSNIEWVVSNK